MIDAKGVEKYLKRAEIAFTSPEEASWIIEQTNDAGTFSVTIQITGGWISFAVLPLIADVSAGGDGPACVSHCEAATVTPRW